MIRTTLALILLVGATAAAPMELLTTLSLPDFNARALTVHEASNRLVVHNCFGPARLNLIQASYDPFQDAFTFDILPNQRSVSLGLGQYCSVEYDNGFLHYLFVDNRRVCEFCSLRWDRVSVITIDKDLGFVDSFTINPAGDEPSNAPVDFRFDIGGIGFRPAGADGAMSSRMVLTDRIKGNLHVIDITPSFFSGFDYATEMLDFRPRDDTRCEWPDTDPGPFYRCSGIPGVEGNEVALEYSGVLDRVILASQFESPQPQFQLQTTFPSNPVQQAPVDVFSVPISHLGVKSIHTFPGQSRTIWPTRTQSFADGAMVEFDVATQQSTVIPLVGADLGALAHDPRETNRFFVPTADRFASDPPLILREFVDGVEVGTLMVPIPFATGDIPAMALDPTFGLLYLGIDDRIAVIRLNASGPFPNPLRDDQFIIPPGLPQRGYRIGTSVALNGGFAFVGVPGEGNGTVAIFRRNGERYTFHQEITAPAGLSNFGFALDAGDDLVVVGAPGDVGGKGGNPAAAILERLGSDWRVKQTLSANAAAPEMGFSVALDGNHAYVGAPGAGTGGAVYAFDVNGAQVAATTTASLATPGARFGSSLDVKAGLIASGAPNSSLGAATAGAVGLFEMVGQNLREIGATSAGAAGGDAAGSSVALSGNRVFVGAPGRDIDGRGDAGAVIAVDFDGANLNVVSELVASAAQAGARVGAAVAATDRLVLAGAPGAMNPGTGTATGVGLLFTRDGQLIERLETSRSEVRGLGGAVGLFNDVAIAGAPSTDSDEGAASLFYNPEVLLVTGFEGEASP